MPSRPRQLALALDHAESYAREDFLSGPCNEGALQLIDCWPDWPANAVALIGPEGSGKTHLAMIWAAAAGARVIAARSLGEAELPAALVDRSAGRRGRRGEQTTARCSISSISPARRRPRCCSPRRTAPATWPAAIPDLVSRLRALPVATLQAPDDAMLRAVIVKLAADRQLALDESVVGYLSTHIERSFAAARAAVIALDNEALRQRRPATRALAAEIFRGETSPGG